MTHVKIAQFKSQLSHYLNRVRHGDELLVTDRKTPIARVIPYDESSEKLVVTSAREAPKMLGKIKIPPSPRGTDSLKVLKEDRQDDLEKE